MPTAQPMARRHRGSASALLSGFHGAINRTTPATRSPGQDPPVLPGIRNNTSQNDDAPVDVEHQFRRGRHKNKPICPQNRWCWKTNERAAVIDWTGLFLGATAFALGGLLKGATGAGAPLLAVPLLAVLYDIRLAVALFTLPSLVPNILQGWAYRHHLPPYALVFGFALGGATGAAVGTAMLVSLSTELLMLAVAAAVLIYVAFRLARPDWALDMRAAIRLAIPMGFAGGVLQGAAGLSAPVSITFMNAIKMERGAFIAAISVFFAVMGAIQIPLLVAWGVLTPMRAVLSACALVPLLAAMPLGAALARRMSRTAFDRIILGLLTLIALRIGIDAFLSLR